MILAPASAALDDQRFNSSLRRFGQAGGVGLIANHDRDLSVGNSLITHRIGQRNWRRLHWATYAIFGAATAHGLMAGTDASRRWAFALYLGWGLAFHLRSPRLFYYLDQAFDADIPSRIMDLTRPQGPHPKPP